MCLIVIKIKVGVCKVIVLLLEEGDEVCVRGLDREWIIQVEEKGESGF